MEHTYRDQGIITSVHLRDGAIYDPSSQGAISFITYEWYNRLEPDHAELEGNAGFFATLVQNNLYYLTVGVGVSWYDWRKGADNRIQFEPSDFFLFPPNQEGPAQPDFSATGSPLQFGYAASNHSALSGNALHTIRSGIDNWSVTIHPVPIPAAAWLFGTSLLGLFGMARRRKGIIKK